jgi:large subunit ribosomal protein L15
MSVPRAGTTSLQASLRAFRLAMSAQRRAAAAAHEAGGAASPAASAATAVSARRPMATVAAAAAASTTAAATLASSRRAMAATASSLHRPPTSLLPSLAASAASRRGIATSAASAATATALPAATAAAGVRLNDLHPALGATKDVRRVGRGDGSGRGKTCGRGTKGQKARKGGKPGLLFDGGTRQLRKWPKVHARPGSPVEYDYVNVSDVAAAARAGLLGGIDFSAVAGSGGSAASSPASSSSPDSLPLVTMKHLRDAGLVSKTIRWGVKLLARWPVSGGAEASPVLPHHLPPMRLQVSAASASARRAVERAGGCVEAVYYNRLGLRALLKPEVWEREGRLLPRGVRAWPPRDEGKGFDGVGALPPRPVVAVAAAAAAAAAGGAP